MFKCTGESGQLLKHFFSSTYQLHRCTDTYVEFCDPVSVPMRQAFSASRNSVLIWFSLATRDATTLNAIDVLQQCGGKVDLALERLCQSPMPDIPQRLWSEEDIRAFVKGLSQYGKDFFIISKDYLPHKPTAELVEFYYLWKKTQEGLQVRPRYRRAPKRTMYNSKTPYQRDNQNAPEPDDYSDDDGNSIDSQISGNHICRNCYVTVSR